MYCPRLIARLKSLSLLLTVSNGFAGTDPVFPLDPFPVDAESNSEAFAFGSLVDELNNSFGATAANPAQALAQVPGVDLAQRGPNSLDALIRGLAGDRNLTSLNGLPLPAASPTGTAAGINFLNGQGLQTIRITTALPSVTHGPSVIGGVVAVEPVFPQHSGGTISAFASINGHGRGAATSATYAGAHSASAVGIEWRSSGDFRDAHDRLVDADYRGWNFIGHGRYETPSGSNLYWTGNYTQQDIARNPSLPLDTLNTEMASVTIGVNLPSADGQWQLDAGFGSVRPRLSSRDRLIAPSAPVRQVNARSESDNYRAALRRLVFVSDLSEWETGVDFNYNTRDAIRTRDMLSGAQYTDHIWPDVTSQQLGLFSEWRSRTSSGIEWRAGARIERSRTAADALDDPVTAIPGARAPTIRENFAAFNGQESALDSRDEWTGSINLVSIIPLQDHVSLSIGAGASRTLPETGYLYRAFLNALGGGSELGNPALLPEQKRELNAGLHGSWRALNFNVVGFLADCPDFIQREVLSHAPLVYGFRNADARFHGWEISSSLVVVESLDYLLQLYATHSRVSGRNRSASMSIAEQPPSKTAIAIAVLINHPTGPIEFEISAYFTSAKTNPTPELMPVYRDADSYTLIDCSLAFPITEATRIAIRIDNLANRLGYSYLQPPVDSGPLGPSSGDLTRGDSIPLPGRSFSIRMEASF